MFNTFRHDEQLIWAQDNVLSVVWPELNGQLARYDKEELISVCVRVPDKAILHFGQLDFVVVERGDSFWRPMVVEEGKRLIDVD